MQFIFELFLIIVCTKLAGHLVARLGQPAVLGKLAVGLVLGPAMLGWVQQGRTLSDMAEIGLLLLMFIAGLETNFTTLRKSWLSSLSVAIGGVIFPLAGGFTTAYLFGLDRITSLFIGVVLSATSISISVQVLKDLNKLNSPEGTVILGAAIFDDVLVILFLSLLTGTLGLADIEPFGWMLVKQLVFFLIIFLLGRFAVPKIMHWVAGMRINEAIISSSLVLLFSFSLLAEQLQVAGMIGAFAAGIAVSATAYKGVVTEKIMPIAYSLFVPVFFVSIGLEVSFLEIHGQWDFILVLSLIACVMKFVGGAIGAYLNGFTARSSAGIGSGMISRGEVALIIATMGIQMQLLSSGEFTALVMVILISTLLTPPILKSYLTDKKGQKSH